MTRVIKADLRHPTIRVCDRARDLYFKRFGLSWEDFKINGIDIETLKTVGQHLDLIDRLEKVAKEREENGSR